MQILIVSNKVTETGTRYIAREWKSIKPSGKIAGPYQFSTSEEAQSMLDRCYPDLPSERKRILPAWSGGHHTDMPILDNLPES